MEEAYRHAVAVLRAIEAGIRPGAVAGDLYAAGACRRGRDTLRAEFHGPAGV